MTASKEIKCKRNILGTANRAWKTTGHTGSVIQKYALIWKILRSGTGSSAYELLRGTPTIYCKRKSSVLANTGSVCCKFKRKHGINNSRLSRCGYQKIVFAGCIQAAILIRMRSVNRVLVQHAHALHQGIYYYVSPPDLSIQEIAVNSQCQ